MQAVTRCLAAGLAVVYLSCTAAISHSRLRTHRTSPALQLHDSRILNQMGYESPSSDDFTNIIFDLQDLGIQPPPTKEADRKQRGTFHLVKGAECEPELRTVKLDLPVEPNFSFHPKCVRLEQCGGCCSTFLASCLPTETENVTLQVIKTVRRRNIGSINVRRNDNLRGEKQRGRREQYPKVLEVNVTRHLACGCICKVQEQNCNSITHTFRKSDCACVCKNEDARTECEQNSKYWNNKKCTCSCKRQEDCGTGEYFSHDSCKCENLAAPGIS